jgi:hypothetical protein
MIGTARWWAPVLFFAEAALLGGCFSSSGTTTPDAALPDVSAGGDVQGPAPETGAGDSEAPDAPPAMDATADTGSDAGSDAANDGGPAGDGGVTVACAPPSAGSSALHGRVFGAYSYGPTNVPIYDVTGADGGAAATTFATVPAAGWLGPMLLTSDGKFYVATNAQNGSIWEISAGGDFTTKQPIAANAFPSGLSYVEGMALDANGVFYLSSSEAGMTHVAKVTPGADGGMSQPLPTAFDDPTGLVVCGGVLLIAEGNMGRVVAHDLTSGAESVWASGFASGGSHISAQMVVDQRGHLLINWRNSGAGAAQGIFDITAGGDLSAASPLVPVGGAFGTDVNEIAVNAANDIFAAGNGGGSLFVARAGGDAGTWAPFAVFATGLSDTESVGIGP